MSAAPPIACRAIDHIAITVPDIDAAVRFFVDLFGAEEVYRRDYGPDGEGDTRFAEQFNVHSSARMTVAKIILAGMPIELFHYDAPDLRRDMPRNCDAGGAHFCILVDDMAAAVARLRQVKGARLLGEPSILPPGHALAGRSWIYFLTPWGLQLEIVSDALR